MNNKRHTLKALGCLGLTTAVLPSSWTKPIVNTIMLPAHAMTSETQACSDFLVERVDEEIRITVSDTQVIGPLAIIRNGTNFSVSESNERGQCANNTGSMSETIELSGTIDVAGNQITGDFIIRQFCDSLLACEQITTFTVTQESPDSSSELGDYAGRLQGTLRCCRDFI